MIDYKNSLVSSSTTIDATVTSEVLRNVSVILSTLEGEVPCDREFGLKSDFLDANMNLSKQLYTITAIDKIEVHEPRATVDNITFENDTLNGTLIPKVVIKIEA